VKQPNERHMFRAEHRGEPLAIDPKALGQAFEANPQEPNEDTEGGVAVVHVCGPLEHHGNWVFDSYESILERVECALGSEAKAIVLCIDSPGGDAAGMIEAHRKIRALREQYGKPIYAFADECAASAAYGIACAADEIWLPETGRLGSIGVIAQVTDRTKRNASLGLDVRLITTGARKGDGNPNKPLDDDTLTALQNQVDTLAQAFFQIVSEGRSKSVEAIASLEAGTFIGAKAVDVGLADGVAGWDAFLAMVFESVELAQKNQTGFVGHRTAKVSSMANTLLTLIQARDEAKKVLLAASSETDRVGLLAKYEESLQALAKYKSEDKEDEKAEDDESEEKAEDDGDEEDEDKEGDDDEDEDEPEEKKSKSFSDAQLFALAQRVTGKSDRRELFGALEGIGHARKENASLRARVQKLEGESKKQRVEAIIAQAKKEGRITPADEKKGHVEWLRAQGMKDEKVLTGFLSMKSKVRTLEDGALASPEIDMSDPLAGLSAAQREIVTRTAQRLNKDAKEIARDLIAKTEGSNGAQRY
jgi:signal peptide peptidase SppA